MLLTLGDTDEDGFCQIILSYVLADAFLCRRNIGILSAKLQNVILII